MGVRKSESHQKGADASHKVTFEPDSQHPWLKCVSVRWIGAAKAPYIYIEGHEKGDKSTQKLVEQKFSELEGIKSITENRQLTAAEDIELKRRQIAIRKAVRKVFGVSSPEHTINFKAGPTSNIGKILTSTGIPEDVRAEVMGTLKELWKNPRGK